MEIHIDQLLHALRPHGTIRLVKKGANVLFQGEIPRSVMVVRDGIIRAYTITSTGEERVVALFSKGDIFPLSWVFGETPNTLFYYDALGDTRLMTVPRPQFELTLQHDPTLLPVVVKYLARQYTALLLRITGLEQSRAVEKIGFTLYYLLFRYGTPKDDDTFVVDLKLSQLMIANLVGLTRESTTKNLKLLRDKGIIDYDKSTYTITKSRLENFLGEDGFRNLVL